MIYVALPCTDPDWEGTVTERTRIYLVATLGANICSVPIRRYRSGDVTRISTNSLCYCAESFWTNKERPRNHLATTAAASSATGGCVVVPEHFGQHEEPAGSDEERTRKKPSFVPKVDLIDAVVFPSM